MIDMGNLYGVAMISMDLNWNTLHNTYIYIIRRFPESWGYPQIIHFRFGFSTPPKKIHGYPNLWKPPYGVVMSSMDSKLSFDKCGILLLVHAIVNHSVIFLAYHASLPELRVSGDAHKLPSCKRLQKDV